MNKKYKVATRENARGKFWCNATIDGYDRSVEADSPALAREKFREETGLTNTDIEWLPIVPYNGVQRPMIGPNIITSQRWRIDENPIG